MLVFVTVLVLAGASAQELDKSILEEVFGKPPSSTPTNNKLEDITITPTTSVSTYQDKDGDACQCVPYYLCDSDLNAINLNDPTLTGYGELDVRFGENCQESVERCCKIPKIKDIPLPQPDPSRLKGCGYRNVKGLDFHISTRDEAQFGEFPWVVALLDAQNNSYYGVGVLIHPQVVMTGAHVAFKFAPGTLKIRAGEWDTQTTKERLQSQERLVDEIRIREDFFPKSLRNDIGLLRLQEPVQLADHINVICMPHQDESFDGYKNCVANGWGKDKFGGKGRYSVVLKRVEVDTVPNPTCNSLLQNTRLGKHFKLHESFICAGGEEGKDTCTGDGGAPLACPIGNDRYKLSGLVAWGIGCGQQDVPAVYARVAKFRQWVDEVLATWGFDTSGNFENLSTLSLTEAPLTNTQKSLSDFTTRPSGNFENLSTLSLTEAPLTHTEKNITDFTTRPNELGMTNKKNERDEESDVSSEDDSSDESHEDSSDESHEDLSDESDED